MALPVAERFCPRNWKTRGDGFNSRSRLSTKPFGVFRGFLQNLHKYGLGSLRKTPMEGTPPQAQVPHADKWPYPYNQLPRSFRLCKTTLSWKYTDNNFLQYSNIFQKIFCKKKKKIQQVKHICTHRDLSRPFLFILFKTLIFFFKKGHNNITNKWKKTQTLSFIKLIIFKFKIPKLQYKNWIYSK